MLMAYVGQEISRGSASRDLSLVFSCEVGSDCGFDLFGYAGCCDVLADGFHPWIHIGGDMDAQRRVDRLQSHLHGTFAGVSMSSDRGVRHSGGG